MPKKRSQKTCEFIELNHITDKAELALIKEPLDKYTETEKLLVIERIRRYRMLKRIEKSFAENEADDETNLKNENALSRMMAGALQVIKQYHAMKKDDAKSENDSDKIIEDWINGVGGDGENE
jgi:uncharacterized protein YjcR